VFVFSHLDIEILDTEHKRIAADCSTCFT